MHPVPFHRLLLMPALFLIACAGFGQTDADNKNDADPQQSQAESVVLLDRMDVTSARFQWKYAKGEHFEMICHTDDTSWLPQAIQKAELIINLLAKNCSLYRANSGLPAKVIYIDDSGLARFDRQTQNATALVDEKNKDARLFDRSFPSAPLRWPSITARNREQLIILRRINYDTHPEQEWRLSSHIGYLITDYMHERLRTNNINFLLRSSLSWTRPDMRATVSREFDQHAWSNNSEYNDIKGIIAKRFRIQKDKVYLCRYSPSAAADAMANSPDFKGTGARPPALQAREQYLGSPYMSLREVLETPLPFLADNPDGEKRTSKERAERMVHERELIDFSDYCVFGPNPKYKEAYARLFSAAQKIPITEDLFKKLFGVGYDDFYNEMYVYYRALAKNDRNYKNSPWGTPNLPILDITAKDMPKPVRFKEAGRSQTARIISDWFALNGRTDIARRTLLTAEADSPWVMNDPEFVAALGLSEARSGDKTRGLALLGQAAAARIVRPEVYRMISRLLLEKKLNIQGSDYKLNDSEFHDILEPLLTAIKQPRPNPGTYIQIMNLFEHIQGNPPKDLLETIGKDCAVYFPDNFTLLNRLAPLLAQNNLHPAATSLLAATGECILSPGEAMQLERLNMIITPPAD